MKNAFKILMFPDSKIYQADSAKSKRQWLDILEDTKKKKVARDKQKKEAAVRLAEQQSAAATQKKEEDSKNPFDEKVEPDPVQSAMETDLLNADWLQELPEDMDMCIAQRDFVGAVNLVERVNEHLKECPKTPAIKEFRARIDHRVKLLTEGLMSELQVSPERSLRGGPRAARRAVAQLIRLGKSAQACDLFLKNRSAIIKYNIRQLKFEGATSLYVRCLCGVFFSSLSETGREFQKAFPEHYGCFSAFILWTKQELEMFVKIFKRHVFDSKSSLPIITECVATASKHCDELSSAGLEVGFFVDSLLEDDLVKMITEERDYILESIRTRAAEDLWRPMNHVTEAACRKYVDEMASIGLDVKDSVYNECFVSLTMNTSHFCKVCIVTCQSLLMVHTADRDNLITDTIAQIFKAQVKHIESSIKDGKFNNELKFILKNAQYILETLMSKVELMFKTHGVPFPQQLLTVNGEYRRLKTVVASVSKN